ncbi:MAG: zinc ribbon domain-containing protein [Gemmatimonadaceae bacterium]
MDDLDRLFRRVVHNVRAAYPELITQSFEVSQLYQQVVPYRLNRRELSVETVEDYELALMQLLSGARGYLTGDADMQRALQDELESLNPDLSAYRGFATSHIALSADAVRALDQQPMAQPVGTPVAAMAAASAEPAAMASRATERMRTSRDAGTAESPGLRSASAPHPKSSAAMPPKSASSPATPSGASRAAESGEGAAPAACRYCSGSLPAGKNIVFCPYCGHDLTMQHCPACNTELEIGWRFCITCGRQVS